MRTIPVYSPADSIACFEYFNGVYVNCGSAPVYRAYLQGVDAGKRQVDTQTLMAADLRANAGQVALRGQLHRTEAVCFFSVTLLAIVFIRKIHSWVTGSDAVEIPVEPERHTWLIVFNDVLEQRLIITGSRLCVEEGELLVWDREAEANTFFASTAQIKYVRLLEKADAE